MPIFVPWLWPLAYTFAETLKDDDSVFLDFSVLALALADTPNPEYEAFMAAAVFFIELCF